MSDTRIQVLVRDRATGIKIPDQYWDTVNKLTLSNPDHFWRARRVWLDLQSLSLVYEYGE